MSIALTITAAALSACVASAASPSDSTPPVPASPTASAMPSGSSAPTATTAVPTLPSAIASLGIPPVDTSLLPISLSNPSAADKAALTACGLYPVSANQSAVLARGARLPHGSDASKYVMNLNPTQAEIQTDQPLWVFELTGSLRFQDEMWTNPTCLTDGTSRIFIATGNVTKLANGAVITPAPVPSPVLSLPSPTQ
jgi:hypothetical protein